MPVVLSPITLKGYAGTCDYEPPSWGEDSVAAGEGMGPALIPPFMIERELAEGRLVCPLPVSAENDKGYYLVIPERKAESAALRAFRDWLLSTAERYRATSRPPADS